MAGAPASPSSRGPSSGWLSSSGSIDHGRFAPGSVLDGRYRVIGLLGRGGMGEVYRADDLRLGQPVALKLLPKALGQDARRLAQFHNEVRTARQVSHPNVCRVYDIGEVDGDLYLSMEYVDGEDLAASLKRIGRFPEDKALELARQIAAGLGAAHDRGVIHRDLKPANIMLDGSGRVRIMDFGLAAIGDVGDVRVGTPAYMAPEQIEGREVTVKSDIYALGLVLYELFTGRRAYAAGTIADLVHQQQSGTITAPTELVKDLDPTIERAILRCIDRDPAKRPASALAVSASLPGGDPLAAALAAGETPSPEMVAAAGGDDVVLSSRGRLAWLSATAALLVACAMLSSRVSILSRTPIDKPPDVLADRAEQLRQAFGYAQPVADRAAAFVYDQAYLTWATKQGAGKAGWSVLASGRPASIRYWRRTSPRPLVPLSVSGDVTRDDPPIAIASMTLVELDTAGRLIRFVAAPPEVENDLPDAPAVDWSPMFAAAGLDQQKFSATPPVRTPPTFADDRRAWQGPLPESDVTVRVEAASYRGRPVLFALVGPWTPATRDADYTPASDSGPLQTVVVLLLLVGAAGLARLNLRSGRADRRGAFRLAAFTFLMMTTIWVIAPHVPSINDERLRLFFGLAIGLFLGGALYLIYLALEPFIRRSWPTMLVGWTRLLSGGVRDSLVGRDLLVGVALGAALGMIDLAYHLVPLAAGRPALLPLTPQINIVTGVRMLLLGLLGCLNSGLQNGLITLFQLATIREAVLRLLGRVTRKAAELIALAAAVAIVTLLSAFESGGSEWWVLGLYTAITTNLVLLVMLRVGLFSVTVMFIISLVIERMPLTIDGSKFYAGVGWSALGLVLALAAAGAWLARGQQAVGARRISP